MNKKTKIIILSIVTLLILNITGYIYWYKNKFPYYVTMVQWQIGGIVVGLTIGLIYYLSSKQNNKEKENNSRKIKTTDEAEKIMSNYAFKKFGMITRNAPDISLPLKVGEEQSNTQVCLYTSCKYKDEKIIIFQSYEDKNKTYHIRNPSDIQNIINMDLKERKAYLEEVAEHLAIKKVKKEKIKILTSDGQLKDLNVEDTRPLQNNNNGLGIGEFEK